jgi:CubicO group peptidase (beta-lactamase class C family)
VIVVTAGVVDSAAIEALVGRCRRDVDEGLLPSCQFALARRGELLVDETIGAPADARYVTFSVTKAFSAALVWALIGDGLLSDSTKVAELVPEFASNGKADVTIEHLLTHTAGFPRAPMRPEEGADPERRRARYETWTLDWPPGSRTEYHATSAYWPLVDIVAAVSGGELPSLFAERVAVPLGLPRLTVGAALGDQADVLPVSAVGGATNAREVLGDRIAETGQDLLLRFNEPAVLAVGSPGAGALARAGDVALFYQALLHNPGAMWVPSVLADATGRIRNTSVDPLIGVPANRTLGLVVSGDDGQGIVRGFGRYTGPRAFGAMGIGGQIAWADPASGLSFCYLTNGLDADVVGSFTRAAKIAGLAARAAS